jgi:hypothetical protein
VPDYIATIQHVREISLAATADADYWAQHLEAEGLRPHRVDGKAQLTISATELRWMGIRFNELVICIHVSNSPLGETADGQYLITAFNTNRFLTWCERKLFKTPYHQHALAVDPASVTFEMSGERRDLMAGRGGKREVVTTEQLWEGPVYIPGQRYFHVKISGYTETAPFLRNSDLFTLGLPSAFPVFQWLADSQCTPTAWNVRPDAVHARSKTFQS